MCKVFDKEGKRKEGKSSIISKATRHNPINWDIVIYPGSVIQLCEIYFLINIASDDYYSLFSSQIEILIGYLVFLND